MTIKRTREKKQILNKLYESKRIAQPRPKSYEMKIYASFILTDQD